MRLKFDNKEGIKETRNPSWKEKFSPFFLLVGARTKVLNQNNLMIIFACNSTVAHSFYKFLILVSFPPFSGRHTQTAELDWTKKDPTSPKPNTHTQKPKASQTNWTPTPILTTVGGASSE